ncbi:MAG: hypothetical protein R2705_12235 [Ilumatobacteraceae bacterium]
MPTHALAPRTPVPMAALVLAHQGGWDELMLVLAPILVIGALILVVQRRADAAAAQEAQSQRSIDAPSNDNRPTKSS